MDYLIAFCVGGAICALVQILMEKTKMLPGRIMVMLVCLGVLLGALQIYQPFVEFAGAGASVPLLGFGNVLWKGVKEAVDENGFLGIFMGGFRASAVGISAALVCLGVLLGALQIYQPFVEFAGAGASVPLLGFGNVLWKGVKEAVDENGFLGIFMGGFRASAVGISAALVFGYVASLIFQPQMKK